MKYDDLLRVPFKKFGRDKNGLDCYGLVMEMCRRAGFLMPEIKDMVRDVDDKKAEAFVSDFFLPYVRVSDKIRAGNILLCSFRGVTHVGYIIAHDKVLHATFDHGVCVSPVAIMRKIAIYEPICPLQR